jgi:hypothetical protein
MLSVLELGTCDGRLSTLTFMLNQSPRLSSFPSSHEEKEITKVPCGGLGVPARTEVILSKMPSRYLAITLKTPVAGLKMAHLPKIALAFEFLSARPDGARA